MVQEENEALGQASSVYEIDIERYRSIAEVFGVLIVPTLVAGSQMLSGLPCTSDLKSFLFQSVSLPSDCFRVSLGLIPTSTKNDDSNNDETPPSSPHPKLASVESEFLDMHGVKPIAEPENAEEPEQPTCARTTKTE